MKVIHSNDAHQTNQWLEVWCMLDRDQNSWIRNALYSWKTHNEKERMMFDKQASWRPFGCFWWSCSFAAWCKALVYMNTQSCPWLSICESETDPLREQRKINIRELYSVDDRKNYRLWKEQDGKRFYAIKFRRTNIGIQGLISTCTSRNSRTALL